MWWCNCVSKRVSKRGDSRRISKMFAHGVDEIEHCVEHDVEHGV